MGIRHPIIQRIFILGANERPYVFVQSTALSCFVLSGAELEGMPRELILTAEIHEPVGELEPFYRPKTTKVPSINSFLLSFFPSFLAPGRLRGLSVGCHPDRSAISVLVRFKLGNEYRGQILAVSVQATPCLDARPPL